MYFCVSRSLHCLKKSLSMIRFKECKSVTFRSNFCSYYRNSLPNFYQILYNSDNKHSHASSSVLKTVHRPYAKNRKVYDESSDDSDSDIIDKYDKNCKVVTSNLTSLRLDAILKSGLGLARNKVDVAFYESRLRINGNKVSKKSQRINVGDEVDLVKNLSPMNPDFLNVARVEVMSAKPDEENDVIIVKMKRFKNLQIENYQKAPYKIEEVN